MKSMHDKIVSYILGFILSIAFTLCAYLIVSMHVNNPTHPLSQGVVIGAILVIAMMQLVVQLFFFLHLTEGENSRWHIGVFIATFTVILTIVIASIWIMAHLNYNMTPQQQLQYIQQQSTF